MAELPEPFASYGRPGRYVFYMSRGDYEEVVIFAAPYAAKKFMDIALSGEPYEWISDVAIRTESGIEVTTRWYPDEIREVLEYQYSQDELEWSLPEPHLAWARIWSKLTPKNPPFAHVGVDELDRWRQWCGHLHPNLKEPCEWQPPEGLTLTVVELFDPRANLPCDPHGLHPAECLRCLSLECIHLNDPDNCARCHELSQLETADAGDAAEVEGSGGEGESGDGQADGRDDPGEDAA